MKIRLTYKDETYILEFTRRSVQTMEKQGFKIDGLDEAPISTCSDLFAGAFLANHRLVKRSLIDEIFEAQNAKGALLKKLTEMYMETYSFLADTAEDTADNPTWTIA